MKFNKILIYVLVVLITGCATVPTEDIEKAKAEGVPVILSRIFQTHPNSAGGVDILVIFFNTSNQTLKYVDFTVMPYNKVGDVAPSEIGRKTVANLRVTGPIKPNEDWRGGWENIWYNNSIGCIEVIGIEVTYMNGNSESFSGSELSKLMAIGVSNSCAVQ